MSLELCVLASGSSGNCAVVRTPTGAMLVDAGIGPRATIRRLDGTGVRISDISSICFTHLDSDHFNRNWLATIARQRITLICHRRWAGALSAAGGKVLEGLIRPFDGEFEPLAGVRTTPIALAHDTLGSHGFVFEGFGARLGYATDLGRVPQELIERFEDLDILALESNYDPQMQLNSGRPWHLKQRIMGGAGHLSNGQAFAAICKILDRCQQGGKRLPAHIVLLHRSRQCNCPDLVRRYFSQDARIAARLTLAHQAERTDWLRPRPVPAAAGEQLTLAWGG